MLREYQINAIQKIEASENKNIMLQMATGSGKTFTFCEYAKRYFAENIKKVLILVHRTELLKQAYDSLGEKCFKIEAGVKKIPSNYDYYVGMVETTNKRLKQLPKFGLVIIDEAHIGNFKKMPFFTDLETQILGVTATPINEYPLSDYYNELIRPIEINQLIQQNFLLNAEVYGFASDLVGSQKFKVVRGDFDEKQMEDFYSSEKMVKNVINAYWEKSAGKKTLIFNVNVNHNNSVYNALIKENLNVYKITGETPHNERKDIINNFKNENDAILCNVGVFTSGFDEPSIRTIILNRATKSLGLYLQMIGRGSRLYENKDNFLILDLGKNTTRHGFYDDFYDWDKFFKDGTKKNKTGDGVAPIKECPECGFIQHSRKIICSNCGFNFADEALRQEKEEKEQKLYLLTRDKPINIPTEKLFNLARERNWKPYAVLHKITEHILNYENSNRSIITREWSERMAILELDKWCKEFSIKNNKWHNDFILKILNDKRELSYGR